MKSHIITKIGIITILSFTFILLTGCGKDDNSVNPTWDEALVGTWTLDNLSIITDPGTEFLDKEALNQYGSYWIIELKDDGKFESDYNLEKTNEDTGTWETSGDKLKVKFSEGGSETFNYEVIDDVLTLTWQDVEDGVEETLVGVFYK